VRGQEVRFADINRRRTTRVRWRSSRLFFQSQSSRLADTLIRSLSPTRFHIDIADLEVLQLRNDRKCLRRVRLALFCFDRELHIGGPPWQLYPPDVDIFIPELALRNVILIVS
jgi:hypothetical protein